jgi:hypothetical protein
MVEDRNGHGRSRSFNNNRRFTMNTLPAAGDGTTDTVVLDERAGPTMHRDLAHIEPTEIDGLTINRTKHKTSPFVPIIKTPTYAENSGNHTGYAVEVHDPDSPTGFRHLGNVSAGYLLLTNEEVRTLAVEIAVRSGLPFKESRIFWDGARFCHVLDFLQTEHVEEGDEVGLSLITRSSYDKSWRYETALMGKRFACDNGVLSGEFFARVAFKHLKGESAEKEQWKEIVREGLAVIDHAPDHLDRFVSGLRLLKRAPMTDHRLREVWKLTPTIGDSIKGQIVSRYVEHEEPTLYGLLNAGTNVFWHREKMTAADFANNDAFTTGLLQYAFDRLN